MSKYLFIVFIFVVVLSPNKILIPQIPAIRIEDILIVILLVNYLFLNKKKTSSESIVDHFNGPLYFIGFIAIYSIIFQELVYNKTIILSDLMIFPMIIKYIIIYKISITNIKCYGSKPFVTAISMSIFVSAIIGIMQYHNILDVNTWLTPLYVLNDVQLMSIQEKYIWSRAVGTIGNPQKFGQLLLIGTAICFSKVINRKHVVYYNIVLLFSIWAIMYTLSRTAVLTLFITFIISFYFIGKKNKSVGQIIKYLALFLLITVLIIKYFALTKGFEERVMKFDSQSSQYSSQARIRDFKRPFVEIAKNPSYLLFGKGPSKVYLRTSMHNDFSWMLERFGILAWFAYILILFRCIKAGINYFKKFDETSKLVDGIIIINVFVIWFCFAFAEDVFKQPQIMTLHMIFIGYAASLQADVLTQKKYNEITIDVSHACQELHKKGRAFF